jgi:hypothetical protein
MKLKKYQQNSLVVKIKSKKTLDGVKEKELAMKNRQDYLERKSGGK